MSKLKYKGKRGYGEHFAKLPRVLMAEPAWRALKTAAQALYPHLLLEWRGADHNNNGKIKLSVRQAAERLGCAINTANGAFHDLEAKGFLVKTKLPCLGLEGKGKCPEYEITALAMPGTGSNQGRCLFKEWRHGRDFPVQKIRTNNPEGKNGKTRLQNWDKPVLKVVTN